MPRQLRGRGRLSPISIGGARLVAAGLLAAGAAGFPGWSQPSPPAAPVARITYLQGPVVARNAAGSTPIKAGDILRVGETVDTTAGGRVQWQTPDDSIFIQPAGSQLQIVEFRFEPSRPQDSSGIYRFKAGAFRLVTGAALVPRRHYVETPDARITALGTDFTALLCSAPCITPAGPRPGLYVRVDDGRVAVHNAAGRKVGARNQFIYVAGPNAGPRFVRRVPPILGAQRTALFEVRRENGQVGPNPRQSGQAQRISGQEQPIKREQPASPS